MMRLRSWGAVLGAVLVSGLLAACASGATGAEPTPTPTQSATRAPTPVDPLSGVTVLVATATSLQLVDAEGAVIEEFAYLDQPEQVLAAIEQVFDAAPVDEERPGSNHTPPSTAHTWGEVEIEVRHYDEEQREAEQIGLSWPRFAVYFDAPEYDGVELTTPSGVHAGDAFADLETELDPEDWTCVGSAVDVVTLDEYVELQGGMVEREYGVALHHDGWNATPADDAAVVWIGAPFAVADGCA
ncbi:hypothetical protein [Agromyces sp. NPDC058104]|uniref:hypothetical protein n=1 Tax=Agromyces sp. NPDC058104 TaxID=3346342 RepID=UPI0036D93EA5